MLSEPTSTKFSFSILILGSENSDCQGTKNVAIYAFSSGKILDVRQSAGVKDMTNFTSVTPYLMLSLQMK